MPELTPEEQDYIAQVKAKLAEADHLIANGRYSEATDEARRKLKEAEFWFVEGLTNG